MSTSTDASLASSDQENGFPNNQDEFYNESCVPEVEFPDADPLDELPDEVFEIDPTSNVVPLKPRSSPTKGSTSQGDLSGGLEFTGFDADFSQPDDANGFAVNPHPMHNPELDTGFKLRNALIRKGGENSKPEISHHNLTLLMANDPILRCLGYNTMTGDIQWVDTTPPWRTSDEPHPTITDADIREIKRVMEGYYGGLATVLSNSVCDDAIRLYVNHPSRRFNPWLSHLESLPEWDGVERVKHALPAECVPHTAYSEQVFLNTYLSLMQRSYDAGPRCQVDSMLVLVSPEQGFRKTSFAKSIAGGIPLVDAVAEPSDLSSGNKDELMKRHQSPINLLDEMDQLQGKADQKELKADLTRTVDQWRSPYDKVTRTRPRRFIMVGTTNDPLFLTDNTGSRRYWPLTVESRIPDSAITRERQDLLLAEARDRYKAGERLDYSDEFEALANEVRDSEHQYDPVGELLDQWFDNPVSVDPCYENRSSYTLGSTTKTYTNRQQVPVDRVTVQYIIKHSGLTASKMQMSNRDLSGRVRTYMDNRPDYEYKTSLRNVPEYSSPTKGWLLVDPETGESPVPAQKTESGFGGVSNDQPIQSPKVGYQTCSAFGNGPDENQGS